MKKLQEIKEEVALTRGSLTWTALMEESSRAELIELTDQVAKRYAEAAIDACAENGGDYEEVLTVKYKLR